VLLEIIATGIDVTERKGAEDAPRASEAKFRDYAETAFGWLSETGPNYKFTLLTENAFGSDPAQRIGVTANASIQREALRISAKVMRRVKRLTIERAVVVFATTYWDHALNLETEPEKWRLVWATLDSCKPFREFVYCGLSGNGSRMYVKASGKPVFDANGEFHGYRGTGTDVTALMRVQEALRESECTLSN
jgi:PAS domain-containing protein